MDYNIFQKNGIFILDESFGEKIHFSNKTRKLNYLLSEFSHSGIMSQGSIFSNNCFALAQYSKKLNTKFLFLAISEKKFNINDYPNMRLSKELGAKIIHISKKNAFKEIEKFKNKFKNYLWIPGGGHTQGSLNEYYKLAKKIFNERPDIINKIDWILLPFATGTTAGGFLKATNELKKNIKVIGVSVSRNKNRCLESILEILSKDNLENLKVVDDFKGMYGKISKGDENIRDRFHKEFKILIDPIYNIRSIDYFYKNKLKNGLIINTGGSANNLL
tara:strand:- start:100 stop:924 length:825 start_codon:yes stop_codon:yes gene_type:complete